MNARCISQGCCHDKGTDDTCAAPGYNFGWRDPNANFNIILAYNCVSGQCDNNAGGGYPQCSSQWITRR